MKTEKCMYWICSKKLKRDNVKLGGPDRKGTSLGSFGIPIDI